MTFPISLQKNKFVFLKKCIFSSDAHNETFINSIAFWMKNEPLWLIKMHAGQLLNGSTNTIFVWRTMIFGIRELPKRSQIVPKTFPIRLETFCFPSEKLFFPWQVCCGIDLPQSVLDINKDRKIKNQLKNQYVLRSESPRTYSKIFARRFQSVFRKALFS